jgi:hypothetical protein
MTIGKFWRGGIDPSFSLFIISFSILKRWPVLKAVKKKFCLEAYSHQWWEHCNENPHFVFPEKELRGFRPNFDIYKVFLPQIRVYWQKMSPQVGTRRLTIWRRRRKTSAGELKDKMSPLHRRNCFKEATRLCRLCSTAKLASHYRLEATALSPS